MFCCSGEAPVNNTKCKIPVFNKNMPDDKQVSKYFLPVQCGRGGVNDLQGL